MNTGRHATDSTIKQPLPITVVTQGSAAMTHNVQGSNRRHTIGHVQQPFTKKSYIFFSKS